MTLKVDQPGQPGEYDEALQVLLQLVWGDGFLSPGGADEVALVLQDHDITGAAVLDIGSGLGAIDQLLVTAHGVGSVVGVDIEPVLVERALVRVAQAGLAERIRFECVTPGPLGFPDASFDVVFSKDSLVQVPDKAEVFADFFRVLKPGGRFIASDWLRGGEGPYSAELLEFFRLEGITYNLVSPETTAAALEAAGFVDVRLRDRNDWYRGLARQELARLAGPLQPLMIEHLGEAGAQHFVDDWRQLVVVLDRGELRPHHLAATKPPELP